MGICVYCRKNLASDTRPAHVIPSSLGGRLKSRSYCCSECNNAIAVSEKRLAEALRTFTSMLGVRRGDNRRARPVRLLDKEKGPLDVLGMIPNPVEHVPQHVKGDGYVEFSSTTPNLPSLARQLAHSLRRTGKTPDDLEAGKDITLNVEKRRWYANAVEATVVLGAAELHACAKMPFELLASHEPELARRPELIPSARSIRDGEPLLNAWPDAVTTGVLTGPLRPPLHSCEVWTAGPYVIGRVVLFGGFPVTVPLAHVWQGNRFSAAHVVDPVAGRVLFNDSRFEDGPLPRGWPSRFDDAGARAAYVQRLADHMHKMMQEATLIESRRRIESEWQRSLRGRPPAQPDLERLQSMLDKDRDHRARRQDDRQPSDLAELLRLVRAEYERLALDDATD